MDSSDFFLTLGEIAAALAGFASVVTIFKRRESGTWDPADMVRFRAMLQLTLAAAFFSVLPVALYHAGAPEPALWAVNSVLLACFLLANLYRLPRQMRRLPETSFSRPLALFLMSSMGLAIALLLLSASAVLVPRGPASYIYAIVLMLTASGILFIRLVAIPPEH